MKGILSMLHQCLHSQHLIATKSVHPHLISRNIKLFSHLNRHSHPLKILTSFAYTHANTCILDSYTFTTTLTATASFRALLFGQQVHALIVKHGCMLSVFAATSLLDMYAKCCAIPESQQVFDEMSERNIVSWNAMISAYVQAEALFDEGMLLFQRMVHEEICRPDGFTLASVVRICAGVGNLNLGKQVHALAAKRRLHDVYVQSCLVEMYWRCGFLEMARRVFDESWRGQKDLVLWTAMIAGYGRHNDFNAVFELFDKMQSEGIKPDGITFLVLLSACSHAGLMGKGCGYFQSMIVQYKIIPTEEHCACLVDLLSRAGNVEEAWALVKVMPKEVLTPSMWGSLLGACLNSANVKLGKEAAQGVFTMDPENVGSYMGLSNLYASANKWREIEELRDDMQVKGLKKEKGCSQVAH